MTVLNCFSQCWDQAIIPKGIYAILWTASFLKNNLQGLVVQRADNVIQWINRFLANKMYSNNY